MIVPNEHLGIVERLQEILKAVAVSRKKEEDHSEYVRLRGVLVQVPGIKSMIPGFIIENLSSRDFREFINKQYRTPRLRQRLVREQLKPLYDHLELEDNDVISELVVNTIVWI